jgi:hypothetical protein
MKNDLNNIPRPRLFQIVITGKRFSYATWDLDCGVKFEHDHVLSSLQVVVDDADLQNTVEVLKEDFSEIHSIDTTELHVGYSPLFHDVIIEGCKAMQLTGS